MQVKLENINIFQLRRFGFIALITIPSQLLFRLINIKVKIDFLIKYSLLTFHIYLENPAEFMIFTKIVPECSPPSPRIRGFELH